MTTAEYPHTKYLMLAGLLGLLGQFTALLFMLRASPATTILFIGPGLMLMVAGMALFLYVVIKDNKARADAVTERNFREGEVIFRQGEPGDRFFVLKSGEVEVIREDPAKGETVLARLKAGEYFGEMALLSDAPRNATVRAATNATVLSLARQEFQSLFTTIPALRQSIDSAVKQRR